MAHCEEYKKAVEKYALDPSESFVWPKVLAVIVGLSIIFAIYCGIRGGFDSPRLYPATCWEIIALADTFILSIFYFLDLRSEAKDGKFEFGAGTPFIGSFGIINLFLLLAAIVVLIGSDYLRAEVDKGGSVRLVHGVSIIVIIYIGYTFLLFGSFLIFAGLDFVFSRRSKSYPKQTRKYWFLGVFVDGPATIAFMIVLVYFIVVLWSGRIPSTEIVSGAVVMQMLIADTLYLLVASNFHLWLLANHLSKGCDQ